MGKRVHIIETETSGALEDSLQDWLIQQGPFSQLELQYEVCAYGPEWSYSVLILYEQKVEIGK